MKIYRTTTQKALRAAFWELHPQFSRRGRQRQNAYPTDTRAAWVDFVDAMARDDQICRALAGRATL